MNQILFNVQLPPLATPHDVVGRKLSVSVDGGEPTVHDVEPSQAVVELRAPQDSTVALSLVDVDDAGNVSAARERSFVALDTVPPPQPGELAIEVLGEDIS